MIFMAEISYTVDLAPGDGQGLAWSLLILVAGAWVVAIGSTSVLGIAMGFLKPALVGLAAVFLLITWSDVRNDDVDSVTVSLETDGDGTTVSGSTGGGGGGDGDGGPRFGYDNDDGSFTHEHPGTHTHGADGWSQGNVATHHHG